MQLFDGKNPSVMSHDFSKVPHAEIGRSMFKRNHTHKTTFDGGKLIPIFLDEVLPGDTFNLRMSTVARLATPIVPIMDNMVMDFFFFFVPNRLVWENFQKFMGEKDNPDDSTEYVVPTLDFGTASTSGELEALSIFDYFGLPIHIEDVNGMTINALPFRCYNLIWNTWFRDQNLQDSVPFHKGDGPDKMEDYTLLNRGKRHDYFTSCLPWPQKGPGVELPLGALAPVVTRTVETDWSNPEDVVPMRMRNPLTGGKYTTDRILGVHQNDGNVVNSQVTPNLSTNLHAPANLWADLSDATASSINSLREAFQLQRLLERDARGGTRYTEILLAHFGVTSPDARLQRPEYLGGGSAPVNIHSVPQTSVTSSTPLGNMAAYGFVSKSGIGFSKAFVEHGYIIGLVSVRADLTYQTGLNKLWSRQTKYDFYWPALAHLGEQPVYNKEIYAQNTADDDLVFGYQEVWSEYRYNPSKITGLLRSKHPQTLDKWHLSQNFAALPVLNDSFIIDEPPIDRVIAVPAQPHFVFDAYFDLTCARPMPMYSVPGLIDHF